MFWNKESGKVKINIEKTHYEVQTKEKNGCFAAVALFLIMIVAMTAIVIKTSSTTREIQSSTKLNEKSISVCGNSNDNKCVYTKYAKFTTEEIINKVLVKESHILAYCQFKLIHVNSYNDIPPSHKEEANSNRIEKSVHIYKGDITLEVGDLIVNDRLISSITLSNNEINNIDLYLQRYRSAQGPPEKTIYIMGQIKEFIGPAQYNKSELFTKVFDLTKNEKNKEAHLKSAEAIEKSHEQTHEYKPEYKFEWGEFFKEFKLRR